MTSSFVVMRSESNLELVMTLALVTVVQAPGWVTELTTDGPQGGPVPLTSGGPEANGSAVLAKWLRDLTGPALPAPQVSLVNDTGSSAVDRITRDGRLQVDTAADCRAEVSSDGRRPRCCRCGSGGAASDGRSGPSPCRDRCFSRPAALHSPVSLNAVPGPSPMATPQERLAALGLALPAPPRVMGAYKPCLVVGSQAWVSGHGPLLADGSLVRGKVGAGHDADAGKQAARQVGLAILSTLVATLGSLDRVRRVVKLVGLVNCTPDFEQHPHVINGCSELFADIWGSDLGVGARSALGAASLPGGMMVEIEAVFEVA